MLILFAGIITVISHSAIADVKHAVACENNPMHLECVTGDVLNIKSANYGRTNAAICHNSDVNRMNRNCQAGGSMNVVSSMCNNTQKCSVYAGNNVFQDPCAGTYKYLDVQYECVKGAIADVKHAVACENNPMYLECVTGEVLNIKSANYGRTNDATCLNSDVNKMNRNCQAGSSMNAVSSMCNNKRICSVYAGNNVFGDPCAGTYKYLDVQYECVKARACKADEFQCYDGSCIPEALVWNGFQDCSNGEDEKGSDYESEFACEGHTLNINCKRGEVISVINANYGRLNRKHCLHSAMGNTNCKAGNSLNVVKNRCNLKPSCSIGSTNGVFGDPCGSTYKYTEVHYECIQPPACTEYEFRCNIGYCIDSNKRCNGHRDCEYGEDEHGCEYLTEFACEHSTLNLECPVGDTITIIGANYGRQESNICTHQSNTNCLSSSSKEKVEARCNGQRSCSVGATNGEFGDPCVGTVKYLSVHYQCRGIHGNEKTPDSV